MSYRENKLFLRGTLFMLFLNVAFFAFYYIFNYVYNASNLMFLLADFVNVSFPPMLYLIGALIIFMVAPSIGYKQTLIRAIPFAVCRIVYLFPYYYLIFIIDGFDSVESSMYSLLVSLPAILVSYAVMVLLALFMSFIARRLDKEKRDVSEQLADNGFLNFDSGVVMSIFFSSLIFFTFLVSRVIIGIISFFVEFGSSATNEELLFMFLEIIFSIVTFVIYHAVLCAIKKLTIKWHFD